MSCRCRLRTQKNLEQHRCPPNTSHRRIPIYMSLGRFSSTADFSTLARASDNGTFREHPLTGHWSASLREGRADTEHPPWPLSYGFFTAARGGTGGSSQSSVRTSLVAEDQEAG